MKLKCIICALLAASAFLSTYSFGDDSHGSGAGGRRSTQDKKITEPTAQFASQYFSYDASEDGRKKDFKTRYETEKFGGKTLVESLNGVKDFSESAVNARKEPTEDAIEMERPIAKAIADMLFVIDQKGYDAAGAELVKLVDGYRTQAGSDTQTEEFQKRLLVAMQNFDPKGESKKEVQPKNEEMNAFAAAWKTEREKVEKELAAQNKLRDDALAGNENARNKLLSGPNAVGKDFTVKMNRMMENGHLADAKKWLKAIAPNGQLALNNAEGVPVTMNINGLDNDKLKKTFHDPKMLGASFVGNKHADNSNPIDWEWTKNGIGVKPGVSPQLGGAQGGNQEQSQGAGSARSSSGASGDVARGATLYQTNCTSCHHSGAGPMSPQGAQRVLTDMPKSESLAAALTPADRQAISAYIKSQLTSGQVAAR